VANADSVADWNAANRMINTAIENFGRIDGVDQQRRHPARPDLPSR
jgi:hypothetical protein